ncbi:site-specific integrase [Candidatus Woesearchaeota archaeon]|nr:site-specific integrase [Candidatus Woesearchaeota archaeon]
MKLDPHKSREKHENWKKKGYPLGGLSTFNAQLLIEYLSDMEQGYNTLGKKPVKPIRLINLRLRLHWILNQFQHVYKKNKVTNITQREAVSFFNDSMRNGKITTRTGKVYTSVDSYAKAFTAFWHWYQRRENEKGNTVKDITTYIDKSPPVDSTFVYFTIDDLRKMAERAKYEYRVLMWFLFDTGMRAPTELMNIKIEDLTLMERGDDYELNIRDEISKTFGRRIKLLLCSQQIKDYIKDKNLQPTMYLFPIVPRVVNQYFKNLAVKTLGNVKTKAGKMTSELTMYDFRHSSACYWLPRYKNESALKYRFGWKNNQMVHHYTKLLGMSDTITKEDMLIDATRSDLEQQLAREKQEREIMNEKLDAQSKQLENVQTMFLKALAAMNAQDAKEKLTPDVLKKFLEIKEQEVRPQ